MKARILWVEGKRADSPSFIPSLRKKDYLIETVPNGNAALQKLQEVDPDLVVVNAASLRSNGKRICRSLRDQLDGLPIILIDSLPGQEEGNLRFVLDHQAGVQVENPRGLSGAVDSWLREDGRLLKSFALTSQALGNPDAAFVIAGALYEAAKKARTTHKSDRARSGHE